MPRLRPDETARAVLLTCLLALHVAVWTLAVLYSPVHVTVRQLTAEGLSTLAVVLMSVNLVLSTRAGVLERQLHGLDKLFVTHRTIGLSVGLVVTAHFILVPKSAGYAPSRSRVT